MQVGTLCMYSAPGTIYLCMSVGTGTGTGTGTAIPVHYSRTGPMYSVLYLYLDAHRPECSPSSVETRESTSPLSL